MAGGKEEQRQQYDITGRTSQDGQRFGEQSAPVLDLGQPADGGEVFRRALQDEIEGGLRLVEVIQLDQGAPERDAGGQVSGVNREAGPADLDRFLMLSSAPAFLGELREGDRRRIPVDPAPQIVNSVVVGHRLFTAPNTLDLFSRRSIHLEDDRRPTNSSTAFLGEREGNRRRILLDPTSQVVNPLVM